ncbi:MAG: nitroreductase family protein [Clostridia bacterium]
MDVFDAAYARRSIRRFKRTQVPRDMLVKLVDCARLAPSGMNRQPLKYVIVDEPEQAADVFSHTRWAGYLKGRGSPSMEQRPPAFILVLNDTSIAKDGFLLDAGAAIQTILLGACVMGLDTCWLGAVDREEIGEIIGLDNLFEIISVVAVGYGDMVSLQEESQGDIRYYLDEEGQLHVPKRKLAEILLKMG